MTDAAAPGQTSGVSGAPPGCLDVPRGGTGEPASTTECRPCKRAYIESTSAQTCPLPSASAVVWAMKRRRTRGSRAESRAESGAESRAESLEWRILSLVQAGEVSKSSIAGKLGLMSVTGQLNRAVTALVKRGLVELTLPAKPNSRMQKYRITESGRTVLRSTVSRGDS